LEGFGAGDRARGASPRAATARRGRAGAALALLLVPQLAGCFQYVGVPATGRPAGAEVAVSITDRGREAMTPMVGSNVRRINGRVVESTDTALVLSVTSVDHLRGLPDQWGGERVAVPRDFISTVGERRLSRGRTAAAMGVVAVAVAVASRIAIQGFGNGDGGNDRPPGEGPPDQ
jgi:hypothetical protein